MFIQETYLFKDMPQGIMNEIARIATEESYEKDDCIFQQGDRAEYFYILEEGKIRLTMGEESHLTYLASDPGDALGWSSLVDRDVYSASAECLFPSKLVKIEKGKLDDILKEDPTSGVTFFKNLVAIIGQRWINSYKAILAASR